MDKQSKERRKFTVYIDESGQDTKGDVFIVSVLILEQDQSKISVSLEEIEKESGKRNIKWNKARYDLRKAYIERVARLSELKNTLFFDVFHNSKEYIQLTSLASAKTILKKAGKDEYKVSVFVDGMKKKEIELFSKGLRDLHVRTKKIRGVKKDENNIFIRLADALCGFIRDAQDGDEWAIKTLKKMMKDRIVKEL